MLYLSEKFVKVSYYNTQVICHLLPSSFLKWRREMSERCGSLLCLSYLFFSLLHFPIFILFLPYSYNITIIMQACITCFLHGVTSMFIILMLNTLICNWKKNLGINVNSTLVLFRASLLKKEIVPFLHNIFFYLRSTSHSASSV